MSSSESGERSTSGFCVSDRYPRSQPRRASELVELAEQRDLLVQHERRGHRVVEGQAAEAGPRLFLDVCDLDVYFILPDVQLFLLDLASSAGGTPWCQFSSPGLFRTNLPSGVVIIIADGREQDQTGDRREVQDPVLQLDLQQQHEAEAADEPPRRCGVPAAQVRDRQDDLRLDLQRELRQGEVHAALTLNGRN